MRLHKNIILLGSSLLFLVGCGTSDQNNPEVIFNHGVNKDFETLGDTQNFLNFTGWLADDIDSNQVAIIDVETNVVLGTAEVDQNNEFYLYSNMQGAGDRELIFSYDDSISVPSVDDVESLNSHVEMSYIENKYINTENSNNTSKNENRQNEDEEVEDKSSETPKEENHKIDDIVEYTSGVKISINSIETTDEEPNGEVNGTFVRVDFTIDNQTDDELSFSAHDLELYDGDRNKAELNSKGFYSENIAPGMKSSGTAYFDSVEDGPFTVIIGAGIWESE